MYSSPTKPAMRDNYTGRRSPKLVVPVSNVLLKHFDAPRTHSLIPQNFLVRDRKYSSVLQNYLHAAGQLTSGVPTSWAACQLDRPRPKKKRRVPRIRRAAR